MADKVDTATRSRIMSSVAHENTAPERAVRRALHYAGYRFRLHRKDLPGTPDIVLPRHKIAVFVHGCFWHQHEGCRRSKRPTSNVDFWEAKLNHNVHRDALNMSALAAQGWVPLVVWECETRSLGTFVERVREIAAIPPHARTSSLPADPGEAGVPVHAGEGAHRP